jgi:nanoRNase/pAp phosphatase (c-di-AMP/oligoRNAs hydrolase)
MALDLEKSREISGKLVEWLRGKGKVLILAHDNPDPDSLAAAMALKHFIVVLTGNQCVLAYGGIIGRGENRVMVQKLDIDAVQIESINPKDFDVVCLVDTQPGTGNNSLGEDVKVDLVIDHHPIREQTKSCRWIDIRENYGSSATILFEYLVAQNISFGTRLATIIYYAIKSETQELGRDWCPADREAYLSLFPMVNNHILFEITHPKVPRSYFFSFNKALENAWIYDDLLIFNLFTINNPDMVAEMADFLLRMEGVSMVFGMGFYSEKEIVSLRTLRKEGGAGQLIRELMKDIGTAGGHGMVAGGQVFPMDGELSSQRKLQATLTERLLSLLGNVHQGRKLLPS